MSVFSINGIKKAFLTFGSEWQSIGRLIGLNIELVQKIWSLRNIYIQNTRNATGLIGFTPDQIDSFAETDKYSDGPVCTYFSSMQIRAPFAVATVWRPNILIIDEALSMRDVYFQHESCRENQKVKEQVTPMSLVSHDANAIQTIYHHALLTEKGTEFGTRKSQIIKKRKSECSTLCAIF